MEEKEVIKIANELTCDLFNLGCEHNNPCIRIEFKGGSQLHETANGGLDRVALTMVLKTGWYVYLMKKIYNPIN